MKGKDIENIAKTMEKWHNRVYKWVCIGIWLLFLDVVALGIWGWSQYRSTVIELDIEPFLLFFYDMVVYPGGISLLIFISYTILFTKFQFPVRFSGKGRGKKTPPPPVGY